MAAIESSQPGRGNAAGRDVAITCIWVLFVSVSVGSVTAAVAQWLQLSRRSLAVVMLPAVTWLLPAFGSCLSL